MPARALPRRRSAARARLERALALIDSAGLRADARRNAAAVISAIAAAVDHRTMRSRPTLARLQERTGLSRRTVQTWCRWFEHAGVLGVLEPGTTPQFRPGAWSTGGNLAREWLLMGIPCPETCTPSRPPDADPNPVAHARSQTSPQTNQERRSAACSHPDGPPLRPVQSRRWPPGQNPQQRAGRLAACEDLRDVHMVLRRLSARHLRSILRPWFTAGWTPADVLYALDSSPGGQGYPYAERVRHPARWLAVRLDAWRTDDGRPGRSHGEALAAAATAHWCNIAARRAEHEAAEGRRAVNCAEHAARARELLRRRLGRGLSALQAERPAQLVLSGPGEVGLA